MDRAEMLALAERCERAEGPDREMDAEIARIALGAKVTHVRGDGTGYMGFEDSGGPLPAWTGLLDDASRLAPPEVYEWHAGRHPKGGGAAYIVWPAKSRDPIYVVAASPALALTAAALRARAATLETDQTEEKVG